MKLIIDIPEKEYKNICLMSKNGIGMALYDWVANGIPLEDIRSEIESLRDKKHDIYTAGLKLALEIIDNHTYFLDEHIKENKQ